MRALALGLGVLLAAAGAAMAAPDGAARQGAGAAGAPAGGAADSEDGFAADIVGRLLANLFVVDDPDRFVAAIQRRGEAVKVDVAGTSARGREVVAFVAVADCAADREGLCDVRVDFEVRDPKGVLIAKQTDVALWQDRPAPVANQLLFGEAAMTIGIASDATLGRWKVTARVTDRVADDTVVLRTGLRVTD